MWGMFLRGYLFPRWSDQLNNGFGGPLLTVQLVPLAILILILLIALIKKKLLFFIWVLLLTAFYWLPLILEFHSTQLFFKKMQSISSIVIVKPGQLIATDGGSLGLNYEHRNQYLWYGYELKVNEDKTVIFGSYYYPGWEVWYKSRRLPLQSQIGELISFTLPASRQEALLQIVFRQTAIQLLSEYLSIGALLAALIYFGYGLFKKTT